MIKPGFEPPLLLLLLSLSFFSSPSLTFAIDSRRIPEWSVQKQPSVQGSRFPLAAEKLGLSPSCFGAPLQIKMLGILGRWEVEVSMLYFYVNGSPKVTLVGSMGGQ